MDRAQRSYCTFTLTVIAAAWFLVALFIGESELLQLLPAAIIPITVWTLVGLLLLAFWRIQDFRLFIEALDIRVLISLHLTRFVGIYFIYLGARGALPSFLANSAGWGDILVAAGAAVLLFRPEPGWVYAWNVIGLLDIVAVVFSAAVQLLTNRHAMDPFTTLPLSFLPTLVVPVIIFTHFVIFARRSGLFPRPVPAKIEELQ
jgi:hypothetical protein